MTTPSERSAARLAAVQALYQMDVSGKGVIDATAEFESFWIGREVEGIEFKPAENAFFRKIIAGTVEHQRAIDPMVDKALSEVWRLTRVEEVLRAILRAAVWELAHTKTAARIVISEYVELAHGFYGGDEPRMVNGVLDSIARELRPGELADRPARPKRPAG